MALLESLNLSLGNNASDFNLKGIDEKFYSLEGFNDAKVLVIIFMCNHCPYVQAVWGRLVALDECFKDRGVQFVGINSNAGNSYYEEDNFENMKKYASKYSMKFPYLIDETQEVAKEYKAQCTPDIYVFDDQRKLAYHGRIDDNWKDQSKVVHEDLAETIEALLDGDLPSQNQKPSMGCSIKWMN